MLGEIYKVSFIGHRMVDDFRYVEEQLDKLIGELICSKEYVEFLVGRNGEFDIMVASAVKRAQKKYGKENSSLILVLPYQVSDIDCFENFYDEIWIPDELHGVHYKAAITKRNEWFAKNTNMLIAYVLRESGGAFACLQKALKSDIITVNIGDQKEKTHD